MLNAVKKLYKKGFTLLELLVVVLIIGILASIALPQYDKAVTKARLAEVLINVKAIEGSVDRYLLKNGFPSEDTCFKDFADIELSGGEWISTSSCAYEINNLRYTPNCGDTLCSVTTEDRKGYSFILEVYWDSVDVDKAKTCYTQDTDKGRFICKYLEPLGWEYVDEEY